MRVREVEDYGMAQEPYRFLECMVQEHKGNGDDSISSLAIIGLKEDG
jgi:hypothetical protein